MGKPKPVDLDAVFSQIAAGDPVGASFRLEQSLGASASGAAFYEAGSAALARREDLGEDALRFARLVFATAVERDPELADAQHDLATTMRELGMAQDAIAHYQRALELRPDDVDSLIGLGAAQCDSGQVDQGIATLKHAAERHPENGQAFANLGVALEAAGLDDEAAGAYAKAVARFDAALEEADDDETAAEAAARRRWARIQHACLLERLQRWPQAVVVFRRLYEEEEAVAEAEAFAAEAEEEAAEEADEAEGGAAASDLPGNDVETDDEALADAEAEAAADAAASASSSDGDGDPLDDEADAGRLGLERVFARLVQQRRLDLAYIVLDDLGGELADDRTRATYAIYDAGDGNPQIMVEHWDGGERERLDPAR